VSDAGKRFTASSGMTEHLQHLLAELIDLHLLGKQAHWNIVGKNFRDLHLQLDEIVADARGFTDQVAERMRALQVSPDGRAPVVAKLSELSALPEGEISTSDAVDAITEALYGVVATARAVHDDVDAEDPTTADLLHGIIERLEQLAWMVSAENRTPR
jgi:starvation-inducible DNA-binding protein